MPVLMPKLRNLTVKTIIIISILYVIGSYIIVEKYMFQRKDVTKPKPKPVMQLDYVVLHLDLKGAPPKLSYLLSILPLLKDHGVNGLLIEYEDMFPYEGKLKALANENCYKKKELQGFLKSAIVSKFEIIPLVQTLGNMEFVLELGKFARLREVPESSNTICPSSTESQDLLREMLQQVIDFHRRILPLKHIHVGCGEVTRLNLCRLCQKRNVTKVEVFTSHLRFVTDTVLDLSPDTTILVWNDIHSDIKLLHSTNLQFSNTDAVYWGNIPNLYSNVYRSNQMFNSLWIATAFKGADGRTQVLPNLKSRFYNHLYWLDFIMDYNTMRNLYRIKGIILTGRSRYNHGAPLCELLPASLHSLIFNLILIDKYRNGIVVHDVAKVNDFIDQHIRSNFTSSLYCPRNMSFLLERFDARSCHYLESKLYVALQNMTSKLPAIHNLVSENLHRYFSGPPSGSTDKKEDYILVEGQPQIQLCTQLFRELSDIEGQMKNLLSVYYEKNVVKEYIGTTVRRYKKTIANLLELWRRKDVVKEKIIG